ncbi:MAG: hypothetical protein J6J36_06195 [Clostridia bacterium]|nr:hypothetical protein [Clostridia bacterium]
MSAAKVVEEKYPIELVNEKLENVYVGLLLANPKSVAKYYLSYEDSQFSDPMALNAYKSVLFTEGGSYTPENIKRAFTYPKTSEEIYKYKERIKAEVSQKNYNIDSIFVKIKKLFLLKKYYLSAPTKKIQEEILRIKDYKRYKDMTIDELENIVSEAGVRRGISEGRLNSKVTDFLLAGENTLTSGIDLPFKILTEVFKGIRLGETMSFAMPSNSGKSRFTINLAAHIAFVKKKKVLIISNEMSEEKMKLCLITTIINNPTLQKEIGCKVRVSEGELLEFKYRPDNPKEVKVDEKGYILKEEGESHEHFVKKLAKYSSEFNKVIKLTDWLGKQNNNPICFMHIAEHTNDDLYKIILNYYYKEAVEYVFYDTLKNDIEHIGSSDEIKKTATILSNMAQKFKIFIGSTLQLLESTTTPLNLTINDMAASRTIKEVLDTLCLFKQITSDSYKDYEYSEVEESKEYKDLKIYENPDVRYYACVVDKNRAGAKPRLLFRLNLAYNEWFELGYLRMKQKLK